MIVLQADQVLHIRADSLLFCASGFYSRSSVEERGEGTWRLDRIVIGRVVTRFISQDSLGACAEWTWTSVQVRRARTEPSALTGQTNTPASAKKVGVRASTRVAFTQETHLNRTSQPSSFFLFFLQVSPALCARSI